MSDRMPKGDFLEMIAETTGCQTPLQMILRGGGVERYHNEEGVPGQRVDSHTWRLLVIALNIWPDLSPTLLRAIIYHDVEEGLSGDLPAPVKWYNQTLKKLLDDLSDQYSEDALLLEKFDLTDTEIGRMKCADYLELCFYCLRINTRASLRIYHVGMRAVGKFSERLNEKDAFQLFNFFDQYTPDIYPELEDLSVRTRNLIHSIHLQLRDRIGQAA